MWFWVIGGVLFLIIVVAVGGTETAKSPEGFRPENVEHLSPGWSSSGGWQTIAICTSCGARGLHWDHMFCVDPCFNCGAPSRRSYETSGQWNEDKNQWETRREIRARERYVSQEAAATNEEKEFSLDDKNHDCQKLLQAVEALAKARVAPVYGSDDEHKDLCGAPGHLWREVDEALTAFKAASEK